MRLDITEKIEIPEGVEVKIEAGTINIKGAKGEVNRKLLSPKVNITVEGKEIVVFAKKGTKREKKLIGTFKAHIKHMIKGAVEGHTYKLKVCSTHFPMTAEVKDGEFSVNNFLGESIPRKIKLKEGVDVKIEGDQITVESPDKEVAGQTAASIEQLCRITDKDKRIFQDGIYLIEKSGKEM
jgi:large subunit ribosomal protein L6